jgi:hypothetical protein
MKNKPDIADLLDRYWEGETTLEEERRLKEFFATEPVPEQFRQEALLFRALRAQQSVQMPAGRENDCFAPPNVPPRLGGSRFGGTIAVLPAFGGGRPGRIAPHKAVAQAPPEHKPAQEIIIQAPDKPLASVEIVPVTTPKVAPKKNTRPRKVHHQPEALPPDTYEDPEKALEEIKAVLALVSTKINKSKQEIDKGLHEVEAVDILFKKKKETNG